MTLTIKAGTLLREGDIGIVSINHPPVNALSQVVREGILGCIKAADADPAIKAIVFICEGRTFLAGADISEFGKPPTAPSLFEVQEAIEASSKPVVAAIHGTSLGGGFEVALCCHYRVAVPSAKCGLPEVHLGLLPGAGGTQRLPRIVGVERALQMVTDGNHVPAPEALAMGLFDELVPEGTLREGAIAFARRVLAEGRPLRKVRDNDDKLLAARGKPEIFAAFRKANARRFRGFMAPEHNIRCIEAAVAGPTFDAGKAEERRLFMELVGGPQSAAQRYYFFAERAAAKIPDVPDDTPTVKVARVGIIGAGTMGGGIAMNFVNKGIPVTLVETAQAALDRGLGVVRRNYETTAKKGRMTAADVETRMGLLTGALDLSALADCDLVIEAVFEDMAIKKDIFGRLDKIMKPGAVLATNTSALDVNEIASATARPQDVIGMHFFSPANVMKLLEVVRGKASSAATIATAMSIGRKVGKISVLAGVCPGFIGNRILAQRGIQAQAMLMEGAMPWDIDRVLYDFGMPMGPFAMSDLAGLDIGWAKERSKSSTIREVLCEMDRRGQKTGAGYYDYDEQRNAKPSEVTRKIIGDFVARSGKAQRTITDEEILERTTLAMINEGAKILDEGIAIRASDIDVTWVNGYGWPVYCGGPMHYADSLGLQAVVDKLDAYGERMGPTFAVSPLLRRMAAEGKRFTR
ncbi:MAG: 3-hydroxyacyl-CoA dehydrogenase NAD-binding domain-containing protein [Aquabacterium sp.]